MTVKSINLFLREGSADKVYQVELIEVDGLYAVHAHNGRRGKPLKLQVKGEGLEYAAAEALYEKVVKSKTRKGYTEQESGVAFSSSDMAGKATGYRPQLYNEASFDEAMRWGADWLVQQKHDGERRGVRADPDGPVYSNRTGLAVDIRKPINDAIKELAAEVGWPLELDTEDMDGYLVIFDVLAHPSLSVQASFSERAAILSELKDYIEAAGNDDLLRVDVPQPMPDFMENRLPDLIQAGAEGFVARRADSVNAPGRPASGGDALKIKFWHDATFRVCEGRDGKNSVGIELIDHDDNWERVGNVTIPQGVVKPAIGSLIDVRYLHAFKDGSVYQPSFTRVRTDLTIDACELSQLHYKPVEDIGVVYGYAAEEGASPAPTN